MAFDEFQFFYRNEQWQNSSVGVWSNPGSQKSARVAPAVQKEIWSQLVMCVPVWSRFSPPSGEMESYLRSLQRWIGKRYLELLNIGIEGAVFYTSSPHHPSSIGLQIACRLAGIPTIFLYTEWISGRSLPMKFCLSCGLRDSLACELSDYDSRADILAFQHRALSGKAPRLGDHSAVWSDFSMSAAVALTIGRVIARKTRQSLSRIRLEFDQERDSHGDGFIEFSPSLWEELQVMRRQKRALSSLKRLSCVGKMRESDESRVIFFSHFQPEASTFPEQGPDLAYMPNALQELYELAEQKTLVYREHPEIWRYARRGDPTRVGVSRSVEFYESLNEDFSERIVFDENAIPRKRDIVATVAGSVALERSLCGMPTIVLGYPWFGNLPGTVSPRDPDWENKYWNLYRDPKLAEDTVNYLCQKLNGKTLANLQGIGGQSPKDDWETAWRFTVEMRTLIDSVGSWSSGCGCGEI